MENSLIEAELQEITDRARKDARPFLTFLESQDRYRQLYADYTLACRLASLDHQQTCREVYQEKLLEYIGERRKNFKIRLQLIQKWQCGRVFVTKSGIKVRSKIEKIIADFLHDHSLRFVYEPIVNLNGFYVMPDFYLSDYDLFLEHLGLKDPKYQETAQRKLARFARFRIRVVTTQSADETNIEEVLTQKLREAGVAI